MDNEDLVVCTKCGEQFDPKEYDDIDDEFNEDNPKCPSCQENDRVGANTCEYCGEPAQHETAEGDYLCDEHFDDYIEHHPLLKD